LTTTSQSKDSQQLSEELQTLINRCQLVIDHLENNPAWDIVLEDMALQKKQLDDNWQFISDVEKWKEFRITKMAVMKITNLIDDYKSDKEKAIQEKYALENPDKVILRDVDNS
jgi:hypothetical protein